MLSKTNAIAAEDEINSLKKQLEQSQSDLNETLNGRDALKQLNTKLESENSILMQDTIRLKTALNEINSQM